MKTKDLKIALNMSIRLREKFEKDICNDDCGGCPFDENCPKTLVSYAADMISQVINEEAEK